MRISVFILMAVAAGLAGCGDNSKTSQVVKAADEVASAPANYVSGVVQAQKHAVNVVDVSAINQAIQMFNVQEGRLPKTLQELVPNYIAKIPAAPLGYKIVYDPATAAVSVMRQ
ncbi:MAG: hypothetical protein WCH99_04555 [Verrucomicrobiota bacterium]